MDDQSDEQQEEQGTVDLVSVLYVVGGIPFMIVFFVGLFFVVRNTGERTEAVAG